ncbi:hypothetical protein JNUCC0626_50465 (plasmid) [Lentzea sp. JNUCC 0626]|uniref:hypothetical protein n=1 Tax=Lentzea sp. JNUCC 0626 TaxID=3367513 RepID=UPI00374A0FB7
MRETSAKKAGKTAEVIHFHETTGTRRQGCYSLVRYYRRGDDATFRVTIYRDSYEDQSHAVAEVFTPSRDWTAIVSNAPSNWHGTTSLWGDKRIGIEREDGFTTLRRLADALARDAMVITPA